LADDKSQERLSNAISEYIISTDSNESSNLPRIIGLEGGWGVGKSNVIQLLESKLKDKYYFFEYDAWGHQEDLQRRSFLEEFTTKLVEDNILVGKTTISVNGVDETIDWHKAKEYLLSRKSKVETSKIPKLNNSFVAMILTVILTTIAVSIANVEKIKENGWLSLLITFVPLFLAFVFLLLSKKRIKSFFKKKMWKELFSDMFVVYSGKIENELVLSAISEREPSVNDFRQWMCNISKYICDRNKRIVIVYDNMDRLPSEQSENRCYAFKIPAITDSPKYCPIEFLYDIDILLSNNVIEKRDYRDYLNLYRDENRSASDNEILMKEFQEGKIPRPYIVKDNMKKYFSEIIQKESDVKLFCNFQNLFHILK
jgi:heme/copper-type cytochrome/quinol oxidase subunit 4